MTIKIFDGTEWVEGTPSVGEIYRDYWSETGYVETVMTAKNHKVVVTSHDKRVVAAVDEVISITAELRDSDDNLISNFNDSFVMPIKIVGGAVARSVLMTFVNGVCNKDVSFTNDGEYQVTEQLINMHLPEGSKLDFEGFSISIYG